MKIKKKSTRMAEERKRVWLTVKNESKCITNE